MEFASGETSHWASVLALDGEAMERAIVDAGRAADESAPTADLVRTWLALMRGESLELGAKTEAIFSRASAGRDRCQVVEVTALRAMISLSAGRLPDAIAFARRASLMARTEALAPAEVLANVVLARVRRHSGRPHLAVRIVEALGRFAPQAPAAWLAWERVLAGGTTSDPTRAAYPDARAACAAERLLLAAQAGQRSTFEAEASELVQAAAIFRGMQDEAQALLALLDADRAPPPALVAFRRGDHAEVTYGLFGAGVFSGREEPGITIFAVARPGERGRRILRDGLGLFGSCQMLSCEDGARRMHGRTDAGLAVLTLTGPKPLAEEEFWKRVYGFVYTPAAHRGVLDVLLHRMRARLGSGGVIARSGGALCLELHQAIAVADPLCSPPAEARILSALARQRLATADALAGRLGITPRAAQMALHQLVSDGACAVRRSGRRVEYQLQDSAFSEPTSTDAFRQG